MEEKLFCLKHVARPFCCILPFILERKLCEKHYVEYGSDQKELKAKSKIRARI